MIIVIIDYVLKTQKWFLLLEVYSLIFPSFEGYLSYLNNATEGFITKFYVSQFFYPNYN